jgi:2-hydroxy-3-keto-5-methylthiopentenyl-1-phosphate phosphatase
LGVLIIVNTTAEQIRDILEKLFKDAGYTVPELLAYIEKLEKDQDQMAETIKKMKLESIRKTSASAGMNSRLKDALRE